jgi:hypothetical protein
LSDDVLESVEGGRKAAIEAVRKFITALEQATPVSLRPRRHTQR